VAEIYGSPSEEIRTTAAPEARLRIEDMEERADYRKEGETFVAYFIAADRYYIGIVRPGGRELDWVGIAGIPLTMEEVAERWFDDIENDTDIENLLREWGGESLMGEFEQFVAHD